MKYFVAIVVSLSTIIICAVATSSDEKVIIDQKSNEEKGAVVTIGFIILLHIVFFYEWYYRICRKEIQSCYQTLIVEKKLYLVLLSLLSHAAATTTTTTNQASTSSSEHASNPRTIVRTLYESIYKGGSLSGLPLLAWSSHLLWKFRFLEEQAGSSISYCRLWISLLTASIALEMIFLRYLCVKSRSMVISSSSSLVGALLVLYYFGISNINNHSNLEHYILSIVGDFLILTMLASPFHLLGSFFGSVSGIFYISDITTFLVQPYWNNFLLVTIIAGCCFSLKAHVMTSCDTTNDDYLPCIDHVSSSWWNSTTRQQQQEQQRRFDDTDNDYDERISSIPLLESQSFMDIESGPVIENTTTTTTTTTTTSQHSNEDRNVSVQFQQLHGPRSRQRPLATNTEY
jgi:hypothetical protein